MDYLSNYPEIKELINKELTDQRNSLKMIASENYCSPAVMQAMSTVFTDKYAEGYSNHRFYAGCENVDKIEELGNKYACELFGADHANIQPHCGTDANMMAYWAILNAKVLEPDFNMLKNAYKASYDAGLTEKVPKTYSDLRKEEWDYLREMCHRQKLLALDYYSGGHLTHGYRQNISAQLFDCYYYSVGNDGLIDYEALRKQALEVKPLILLAGYSAYPRALDFKKFREIADECGAVLMVDMAHFAGLVAGKVFQGVNDPIPYADIVTTTTPKTFRGPRGGMILCKEWLADSVDKGCPLAMGGPLAHVMLAKVVALKEALTDEYKKYAQQIVKNSKELAKWLQIFDIKVCTDGTDNHIVLLDVSPLGLNGKQAEYVLRKYGITCNRNAIPNDPNGPWYTSGIRLGTAALTTRGFKEEDMRSIALIISSLLNDAKPTTKATAEISDEVIKRAATDTVKFLCEKYPLYEGLEI